MVVVLDDRADVWQWSQSLIKVRPYHYFLGTGDINAPPIPQAAPPPDPTPAEQEVLRESQDQLPPPPTEEFPFDEAAAIKEENKHRQQNSKSPTHPTVHPPFLLEDHDRELFTLTEILQELHSKFYQAYDASMAKDQKNRVSSQVNVKSILPKIKERVFKGFTFAFSGVIPLGVASEQ